MLGQNQTSGLTGSLVESRLCAAASVMSLLVFLLFLKTKGRLQSAERLNKTWEREQPLTAQARQKTGWRLGGWRCHRNVRKQQTIKPLSLCHRNPLFWSACETAQRSKSYRFLFFLFSAFQQRRVNSAAALQGSQEHPIRGELVKREQITRREVKVGNNPIIQLHLADWAAAAKSQATGNTRKK